MSAIRQLYLQLSFVAVSRGGPRGLKIIPHIPLSPTEIRNRMQFIFKLKSNGRLIIPVGSEQRMYICCAAATDPFDASRPTPLPQPRPLNHGQ
jgi:hypothetical protein